MEIARMDPSERIEWTMFLIDELASRKPNEIGGRAGPEEVAILLEIAKSSLDSLIPAAEGVRAYKARRGNPNRVLRMIHFLLLERKELVKGKAQNIVGLLSLTDGKLEFIQKDGLDILAGLEIEPFSQFEDGQTYHQSSVAILGRRDLASITSRRLTSSELVALLGLFHAWSGEYVIPAEPAQIPKGRPKVGAVRSIDCAIAFAALKSAGIHSTGEAIAGTVFIDGYAVDRDKAKRVLRLDAKANGYMFRE